MDSKKWNRISLLAMVFIGVLAVLSASAWLYAEKCSVGGGSIEVTNGVGAPIAEIYTACAGTGEWSKNLLEKTLEKEGVAQIAFNRALIFKLWDVKAVLADGKEIRWKHLPLPNIYEITLLDGGRSVYVEIKGSS